MTCEIKSPYNDAVHTTKKGIDREVQIHIISTLNRSIVQIISDFKNQSNGIIGFDTEFTSNYRKLRKKASHIEKKSKRLIWTIQLSNAHTALVFRLNMIYNNDQRLSSKALPRQIMDLINDQQLICFGGDYDLQLLRENWPHSPIHNTILDPSKILQKNGAIFSNLVDSTDHFLNQTYDKGDPNIDWSNPSQEWLIKAGLDAFYSYKIWNKIEELKKYGKLDEKITHFNIKMLMKKRKNVIRKRDDPIVRAMIDEYEWSNDEIKNYSSALNTFMSKMYFRRPKFTFNETREWKVIVHLELGHPFEENYSIIDIDGVGDTKKIAKVNAIKKALIDPLFRSTIRKYLVSL